MGVLRVIFRTFFGANYQFTQSFLGHALSKRIKKLTDFFCNCFYLYGRTICASVLFFYKQLSYL